jgi:hypothetical protein
MQNLENGYHDVEEHKVEIFHLCIYILPPRLSIILINLMRNIVTFQEPQSAPPAIKEYGNGDPKLRKSCADRQIVGHLSFMFKLLM